MASITPSILSAYPVFLLSLTVPVNITPSPLSLNTNSYCQSRPITTLSSICQSLSVKFSVIPSPLSVLEIQYYPISPLSMWAIAYITPSAVVLLTVKASITPYPLSHCQWPPVLPYLPSVIVSDSWTSPHRLSLTESESQYYPISSLTVVKSQYYPIFLFRWQWKPILFHLPSLSLILSFFLLENIDIRQSRRHWSYSDAACRGN